MHWRHSLRILTMELSGRTLGGRQAPAPPLCTTRLLLITPSLLHPQLRRSPVPAPSSSHPPRPRRPAAAAAPAAVAAAAAAEAQQEGTSAPVDAAHETQLAEILQLVNLLPPEVAGRLRAHPDLSNLIEVVMDLGRPPLARFPGRDVRLAEEAVSSESLALAVQQV
jgi:hypothetical protein